MPSVSDAIVLRNGASSRHMLDWASQERTAHGLIVRVDKTQLAGHHFAGLFLDHLEELLGNCLLYTSDAADE